MTDTLTLEVNQEEAMRSPLHSLSPSISNAIVGLVYSILAQPVELRVRAFREGAKLPVYSTDHAAGMDVHAYIADGFTYKYYAREILGGHSGAGAYEHVSPKTGAAKNGMVCIEPGNMLAVPTGLNLRIPAGYELQVRPRSGLAYKHQLTVMNAPGTIDADYDGDGEKFELMVMLYNAGFEDVFINHGDRIAQLVLSRCTRAYVVEDTEDNSHRNVSNRSGGLGHTGKN